MSNSNNKGDSGPVVAVLEMIHEDIKGLKESQESMGKSLIELTAQQLAPRIGKLEEKAHQAELSLARLDPQNVKSQLEKLREGQVKLMIKVATIGGGAGLAGGGLLYWIMQMVNAAP